VSEVVELERVTRKYNYSTRAGGRGTKGEVIALADISMTISKGEIIGLLGPNGAGKTTLIKIISTVLLPTSGSVKVLGFDIVRDAPRVRQRIGIVFGGERGLYGRLTVRENLEYWSAMYRVPRSEACKRIPRLLERIGLASQEQTPFDRLSKGMKQRVHLARGLLNDPELVIMDEPTSGMDPVAAREFRELVRELCLDGRTILLATHDMVEAERLCNRVALIDHGRIRGIEDPKSIGQWLTAYGRIEACVDDCDVSVEGFSEIPGVSQIEMIGDGWVRIHTSSEEATASLMRLLVNSGVTSVRTSRPSLEEVYLQVIGDRGLTV